ncbi:C-type lectin domain family 18 member A-like [Glandiceps talaboti]
MMIRVAFLGALLSCAMAHADFTIISGGFNMADAVDACQNKGLSLARITTGCEFDSMLAYIDSQGLSGKEFWIDAKTGDNGFLEANDGTLLPYNNFVCGQPDGSGQCVQLWASRDLLMDDTPCSYGKNAICEG